MLETKIDHLIIAVKDLTSVIENIAEFGKNSRAAETKVASKNETKVASKNETKVASKNPDIRNELIKICLDLVRMDSDNKIKIKKIIGGHDAELIKDVPENELETLKAELEDLR